MRRSSHEACVIVPTAKFHRALTLAALLSLGGACGDSSENSAAEGADGGSSGGGNTGSKDPGSASSVDEAVLARCPQSTTLIETTEWMTCLEGERLVGIEPFNNKPCELRIGSNGAFEYLRDGAVAIAVPERSAWLGASGNYQNDSASGSRFFLAGIAPDLPPVEGEERVTHIDISLFAFDGKKDNVAVRYLDAALANQTYNCQVDVL